MFDELQVALTVMLIIGMIDQRVRLTKLRVCFDEHINNNKKE